MRPSSLNFAHKSRQQESDLVSALRGKRKSMLQLFSSAKHFQVRPENMQQHIFKKDLNLAATKVRPILMFSRQIWLSCKKTLCIAENENLANLTISVSFLCKTANNVCNFSFL